MLPYALLARRLQRKARLCRLSHLRENESISSSLRCRYTAEQQRSLPASETLIILASTGVRGCSSPPNTQAEPALTARP